MSSPGADRYPKIPAGRRGEFVDKRAGIPKLAERGGIARRDAIARGSQRLPGKFTFLRTAGENRSDRGYSLSGDEGGKSKRDETGESGRMEVANGWEPFHRYFVVARDKGNIESTVVPWSVDVMVVRGGRTKRFRLFTRRSMLHVQEFHICDIVPSLTR